VYLPQPFFTLSAVDSILVKKCVDCTVVVGNERCMTSSTGLSQYKLARETSVDQWDQMVAEMPE